MQLNFLNAVESRYHCVFDIQFVVELSKKVIQMPGELRLITIFGIRVVLDKLLESVE